MTKTMLHFAIKDGILYDTDGTVWGLGYSGTPEHRNNPDAVNLKGKGPLPPGRYLVHQPVTHMRLGPLAFQLTMVSGKDYGRSGFWIHGDNANHDASHGCIVLPPKIRRLLKAWVGTDGVPSWLDVEPALGKTSNA